MSTTRRESINKNIKNIAGASSVDEAGNVVIDHLRIEAEKAALLANVGITIAEAIRESGHITNNVTVQPASPPDVVVSNHIHPKNTLTAELRGKIRAWMRYHRFTKATR